jgi:hypothetical protein
VGPLATLVHALQPIIQLVVVFAEPDKIRVTRRYAHIFMSMPLLAKLQARSAGFEEPYSNLSGDLRSHQEFAQAIHLLNELENLSILAYVHDSPFVLSFLDWPKEHFDYKNCPHHT